jgi:hypothetical protein
MNQNLQKLVAPSEYKNDEVTSFAAISVNELPGPIEDKYWCYTSERLWSRLLSYGAAYDLHYAQSIEPIIDSVLLPEQCDSFSEELVFILSVTTDVALKEFIQLLLAQLNKVINRANMRLIISPP